MTFAWRIVVDICTITGALGLTAAFLLLAFLAWETCMPRPEQERREAWVVAEAEALLKDAAR